MKFSQLIMLIIIVNLLNVMVSFSMQSSDINDLEDRLVGWFSNDDNGFSTRFDSFEDNVRTKDNWLQKIVADVMQGISQAINLVIMSVQILLLVLWGWISPWLSFGSFLSNSDEVTFLKLIGMFAYVFIQWFNIMLIIRLVKFVKGTDS